MNDTYNNTYINTNTGTSKKIKDSEHIKDVEDDEDNKDTITIKMKSLLDSFLTCHCIDARINKAIEIFTYILTIPIMVYCFL